MPKPGRATAALLLAVGLTAGCTGGGSDAPLAGATDAEPVASPDAAAYPDSYRDLDLPVLPGGVVTSAGRQSTSLRDGLSIRLTTSQSVAEARSFYENHMTELGWTPAAPGPGAAALPDMPVAMVVFTKAALNFQATITAAESGSLVGISVIER